MHCVQYTYSMRTNIRAAGIVIKDDAILLIEGKKSDNQYFVFPGGGVEHDESIEQAIGREIAEETSIDVLVGKQVYELEYTQTFRGIDKQHFYICQYISGLPELGDSPEKAAMEAGFGFFKPQWIPLQNIKELRLFPFSIRDRLYDDAQKLFDFPIQKITVSIEHLQ